MTLLSDQELEDLADRWIEWERSRPHADDTPALAIGSDVSGTVLHMPFDQPEQAWRFVELVLSKTADSFVLGRLAAGTIEDLLAQHGADFVDRIAELAEKNPIFRGLLHGVWRSTISADVWDRVERIRSAIPRNISS